MTVFDSSVLIAHLRGDERATKLVLDTALEDRLASVLARIDIEGGMRSAEPPATSSGTDRPTQQKLPAERLALLPIREVM